MKNGFSDEMLPREKVGHPRLLGDDIDNKVQEYLHILRRKGAIVNSVVALATAKALIQQSQDEHVKAIDLENTSWTRSLFQRMGFVRKAAATGRPTLPDGAVKEVPFSRSNCRVY